jgi:hypothetical protein
MLHFTVKLRGNQITDLFSAAVPTNPNPFRVYTTITDQDAVYLQNNGVYNYPWAEVVYFLRPQFNPQSGNQDQAIDPATGNSLLLYTLYRRQLLAVPDNSKVQNVWVAATAAQFTEMSCQPDPLNLNNLYFNNPADLTMPARRFNMDITGNPLVTGGRLTYPTLQESGAPASIQGGDVLLTDVISFDVRVMFDPNGTTYSNNDLLNPFVNLFPDPYGVPNGNVAPGAFDPLGDTFGKNTNPNLFAYSPSTMAPAAPVTLNNKPVPRVFDTWSRNYMPTNLASYPDYSGWGVSPGQSYSIPMWSSTFQTGPLIKAIQVTIRVWDAKTLQTRQTTIVQSM